MSRLFLPSYDDLSTFGRDRGTGTALPTDDLTRGDTYLHTAAGLFVYTGAAWRQATGRHIVADTAARTAISTTYVAAIYAGYMVRQSDTGNLWQWTGSAWDYAGGGTPPAPTVTDLPLAANWGNVASYRNSGYYKDRSGVVHLTSLIQASAAMASGALIATLPAGFRPGATIPLLVPAGAPSNTLIRVDIYNDGNVLCTNAQPTATYIFWDSVKFPSA